LSRRGGPLDSGQSTQALDLAESELDLSWLEGVDVIFHLAGVAHQHAQESAYTALNYQATVRLAHLAAAAGVSSFIYLSSVKAMGAPASPDIRTELQCTTPVDAYGLSKWQAECALRETFSTGQISVAIVRPALVYGREAKGNLKSLAAGVRWGLPRPPPIGRRSMIALDDLVDLLMVIAGRPPAGVQTWIACGADSYSTQEIYDLLRTSQGKGKGIQWLPRWVWQLGARLVDVVSRGEEPTYDKMFGTELYSNAAVVDETRWRPRLNLETVIDQWATVRSRNA
jgi:nucleoside-diphosphate-sugar epimerase